MGVFDAEKKIYRKKGGFNIVGVSDILGIYNGRFLAIEVKTPMRKKSVTMEQTAFILKMKKMGALAFVATDLNDVIEGLR